MSSYISTRGPGDPKNFTDVLLSGMAPDGGLYIPDQWPSLDRRKIDHLHGMAYADIAQQVMQPFIGETIPPDDFKTMLEETYSSPVFDHNAIAPLVQVGPNAWVMELFHGPTLSFKDYALQLLGRLFDYVLEKQGQHVTIIGATSGDTGSAAIEACKGCKNIDIFILHPKDRTSDVQRRQMTTVDAPNVHNIALEGTFDDCQTLVKELFADEEMQEKLNLSAVNSINWARIAAQTVYYVSAAISLGAPSRPVSFAVPTGNFGNIYAAWVAREMGLPVHQLVIGTNRNDIITRFFETGEMKKATVEPSLSPSMDIQVSSNFERYLCALMGHDHNKLSNLMTGFKAGEPYRIESNEMMDRARRDFSAHRCDDQETLAMMKECHANTGMLIDPHTAVAMHAAMQVIDEDPSVPMIILACAHPAKFPEAVEQATGKIPEMPPRLEKVMKKAEHYTPLANDFKRIKSFVLKNSKSN